MSNLCEECGNEYTHNIWKWCRPCQTNSLKNYTTISDNEKINNFIQKMRSKIDSFSDIVFEWIPYDQFNNINKINNFANAVWTDGRLEFSFFQIKYIRSKNIKVSLKFSQYNIDEFLNEANKYSITRYQADIRIIYGISQNPDTKEYIMVLDKVGCCERCDNLYTNAFYVWCKSCQINYFIENFTNWTSGNDQIDYFIREIQLRIDNPLEIIFEWIPYNQFSNIKKISKNDCFTTYSAMWKDGPLSYNKDKDEYVRSQNNQNKTIILKCLSNKPEDFINEIKAYPIKYSRSQIKYGISQNPNTNDYIIVLQDIYCEKCNQKYTNANYNWCKSCQKNFFIENFTNWTSGNEKINSFIQEMQLRIESPLDIIFEWIPYNQFNDIKEINEDGFTKALWKDGPLNYDEDKGEYKKSQSNQNKEVTLKYLYNLQNITNEILNEIYKTYSIKKHDNNIRNIYGISQNPNTKEYIIILQYANCEKCIKKKEWCKFFEINYLKENFANWTSGNKEIDNFIQKMQLKINYQTDIVAEWIPYSQFDNIKEINKNGVSEAIKSNGMHSAIWKDGPLNYDKYKYKYTRSKNEKVTLKCLHNSQYITDEFLNEIAKTYSIVKYNNNDICYIYGITQRPNTKEYILVLQNGYCIKCYKKCTDMYNNWCKPCEINSLKENFVNWTSGNIIINNFIQEMQMKIDESRNSIIFEWIPYSQFDDIEVVKIDFITVHSAIWKDGPLNYELDEYKYTRSKNAKVILKRLHSQNITDKFLNEIAKTYSIRKHSTDGIRNIYGISQNPNTNEYIIILQYGTHCEKCNKLYTEKDYKWCKSCQINSFKENFVYWTSVNEKVDFIKKMQLKIDHPFDIVFEWIPYNQFSNIKEIDFGITYSAIWKDGPLNYDKDKMKYMRSQVTQNKNITLKYLYGSLQNITDELIFKIYSIKKHSNIRSIYGMSQNPNTKEFIMVLQDGYCEKCDNKYTDLEHKWCKSCQIKSFQRVLDGKNEKIDNFILEMRLKIDTYNDTVVEWIPYNQFKDIKEIAKIANNDSVTIYSAIWMSGQLFYNEYENKYTRNQIRKDQVVTLKCYNSRGITDKFLNETKEYSIKYNDEIRKIYGITQTPYTQNYIMVLQDGYCEKCSKKYMNILTKWCKPCEINSIEKNFANWSSGNYTIDKFIKEMQLKINLHSDIMFEWVPYDQFGDIKEVVKTDSDIVHSAIWKNGPLVYDKNKINYIRSLNKKIALKYLHNSQNTTTEFLNEIIKLYSIKEHDFNRKIYGITQNPDTKEYIAILQDGYCEKCGKYSIATSCTWCKPFQIDCGFTSININEKSNPSNSNTFKFDFNFTSNEDNFKKHHITKKHRIITINDSELIPYNQFNNIKEIGKGSFSTVYSAIWKNGIKESTNKNVALKYLHSSQNIIKEFIEKVKVYSVKNSYILDVYGITRNPDTKEYIIVLKYVEGGSFNNWIIKNYKIFSWEYKMKLLYNITYGLKIIHQNHMVHHNLHAGNILIQNQNIPCISDIGLYNMNQTQIYGVMPYVAPEVLKGKDYTQAADIYGLGMVMYFIATGKQPFFNCAHDQNLALNICNGIRPEINDLEAPKCYIDLMKRCWDSNPVNRPKATEVEELIKLFYYSYKYNKSHELDFKMIMKIEKEKEHYEIEKQFKEAEEFKKSNNLTVENNPITHSQAIYTSQLLNPFIEDLLKM